MSGAVYKNTLTNINDSISCPTANCGSVGVFIKGTSTNALVIFEGSKNKTVDWEAVNAYPYVSGTYGGSVANATGIGSYSIPAAGYTHIRAKLTGITSGALLVSLVGTEGTIPLTSSGGGGGSGDASAANQTSTLSNAGTSASKATGIQGIAGGIAVPVSLSSTPSLTDAQLRASAVPVTISATDSTNIASIVSAFTSNTQTTKITDGTQSVNTLAGDTGQNALLVAPIRKEITFTTTVPTTTTGIDVSNYRSVLLHATSQGTSSSIAIQFSNDNTNWITVRTQDMSGASVSLSTSITTTGMFSCPVLGRYFRLSIPAISAGTTSSIVEFGSLPFSNNYINIGGAVSQSGTWLMTGGAAHAAAISGNPLRVGGRAVTTNYTAVTTGQTADFPTTLVGVPIVRPYSIPEAEWSYAAASGGISNTTTAVQIQAAAATGIRNYITSIQISTDALGVATEIAIRDGAGGTVIWRMKVGTSGIVGGFSTKFANPIKSSAATLLEVVTLTASVTGAVYFNAQGFTAP